MLAQIAALADAGFDIAHPFDARIAIALIRELTPQLASEPALQVAPELAPQLAPELTPQLASKFAPTLVPQLASIRANASARCALLVGNTRALWPRFTAALAADTALAAERDPLDRYTEATLASAFPNAPVYFAHRTYAERTFIPFQRLAVAAGLGSLSPAHLVIHPTYGPWFALRALVFLDPDAHAPAPPSIVPLAPSPCCTADCAARFAVARDTRDARAWLALRDACPVGRAHRYADEQIAYHYGRTFGADPGRDA